MKIKNLFTKRAAASYLEVSILVIAIFAFAFLVAFPEENTVIAQELESKCCRETKAGAYCQEMFELNCNNCKDNICLPTKCEQVADCKLGCCINPDGKCIVNSPRMLCENSEGTWRDKPCNNIVECATGCCILGDSVRALVTERECEFYSAAVGVSEDFGEFRRGVGETDCLALKLALEKGACVYELGGERLCKFTTFQDCEQNIRGGFSINFLCSNPELNTICKKQDHKGCLEGKDEVYWFDSCGNPENIYSGNGEASWNSGMVLSKNQSCNPSLNNAGSQTCGNCNYFLGSKCKLVDDNYYCQDLDCHNAPDNNNKKKYRKNGESWCVYDGAIGNGRDLVGSRHRRYSCIEGDVKVEPCADFRNEICAQTDIDTMQGKFSNAACKVNKWQECMEGSGCAKKTNTCFSKTISLSKDIPSFSVCLPSYPPGFDIRDKGTAPKEICKQASYGCTVVWEKKLFGWECVQNCECMTSAFTQQMSDWCTSLGDCGFKKNIAGRETKNYQITNAPDSAQPIGSLTFNGNYPKPETIEEILGGDSGWNTPTTSGNYTPENYSEYSQRFLEHTLGAAGIFYGASYLMGLGLGERGVIAIGKIGVSSGTLSAFGNAAIAAAAGYLIGKFIATDIFGMSEYASQLAAITSAVVVGIDAAIGAIIISQATGGTLGLIGYCMALPMSCIVGFGLDIIVTVFIVSLLDIGETEQRTVTFTCQPWQPPSGGTDCEKCNNNPLEPCSKYRCQSLGKACRFVNEGTIQEKCIASINDKTAPAISPWQEVLTQNYTYKDITSTGFKIRKQDGSCIESFTLVDVGIKTNEIAQCKYDTEPKQYDEMGGIFDDGFLINNHSMSLFLPSVESIAEQYGVETEFIIEKYGSLKFYVNCQDDWGNSNLQPYLIDVCVKTGPDTTPPLIMKTKPENNMQVAYAQTIQNITVYTNEPANCKYDTSDKEYKNMRDNMECKTSLTEQTVNGWPCSTSLDISQNDLFYIRCKDKPWLLETNQSRNANRQSYQYSLGRSISELKIDSLQPNKTIKSGTEPFSITLTVKTSGGADGTAACYYSFTGDEDRYIMFFDTGGSIHEQVFNSLIRGDYKIYVKCQDRAGNKVYDSVDFKLEIDDDSPKVTRFYFAGNVLKIITDEESDCRYSTQNCRFRFNNGTEMYGYGNEYEANKISGIYHIKCMDLWGNVPIGCTIKIRIY